MGDYLGDYRMWASPSGVKVAFIGAIADDVPTKLFPGTVDSLIFEKRLFDFEGVLEGWG